MCLFLVPLPMVPVVLCRAPSVLQPLVVSLVSPEVSASSFATLNLLCLPTNVMLSHRASRLYLPCMPLAFPFRRIKHPGPTMPTVCYMSTGRRTVIDNDVIIVSCPHRSATPPYMFRLSWPVSGLLPMLARQPCRQPSVLALHPRLNRFCSATWSAVLTLLLLVFLSILFMETDRPRTPPKPLTGTVNAVHATTRPTRLVVMLAKSLTLSGPSVLPISSPSFVKPVTWPALLLSSCLVPSPLLNRICRIPTGKQPLLANPWTPNSPTSALPFSLVILRSTQLITVAVQVPTLLARHVLTPVTLPKPSWRGAPLAIAPPLLPCALRVRPKLFCLRREEATSGLSLERLCP